MREPWQQRGSWRGAFHADHAAQRRMIDGAARRCWRASETTASAGAAPPNEAGLRYAVSLSPKKPPVQ